MPSTQPGLSGPSEGLVALCVCAHVLEDQVSVDIQEREGRGREGREGEGRELEIRLVWTTSTVCVCWKVKVSVVDQHRL